MFKIIIIIMIEISDKFSVSFLCHRHIILSVIIRVNASKTY